jgi:hypothetical protein
MSRHGGGLGRVLRGVSRAALAPAAGPMKRRGVVARRAARRVARQVAAVPPRQLALRGVVGGAGAIALLIAPGGQLVGAGLVALLGVPALLAAVVRPGGAGPAVVLGAAAGAWAMRYGVSSAPLGPAFGLAAVLYLHHAAAALGAAMPATATVDGEILLRWGAQAAAVLGLTGVAAGGLRVLGRPAASPVLELVGIAAAVGLAALLVALARSGRREPAK